MLFRQRDDAVKWLALKGQFLVFKWLKLSLPALATAGLLTYSHFFEKPLKLHRQVFSTMTQVQRQKAEKYIHRYDFRMSYIQCGAAYDSKGHTNNCKYLILAMNSIHDCEKAGIPVDRQALVSDTIDDFLDDFRELNNPKSQLCQLGIDPWERFW
jgi:hypothetical protein